MRKSLFWGAALAFVGAIPMAHADPASIAINACQQVVSLEATRKHSVDRAEFLGHPKVRQVSNAEAGVSGRGQLDTNRGWVPFSYSCVYNIRNGRVSNVNVKSSASSSSGGKDAGAVVGAIIGTAIAGAIIESVDKKSSRNSSSSDGGWWSPSPGISCNSYQSACFANGRFNAHWTNKIYR